MDARYLRPGDLLLTHADGLQPVTETSLSFGQTTVYNIEVNAVGTYGVGPNGILVHNRPRQIKEIPFKEAPESELHRPYVRKDVRAEVDARAPRTADGRPIDPNTMKPIDGKPDLGHKPGHEFRAEKARAEAERLTQEQFNDRMNNPDLYQLEDSSSNRSHRYEAK